MFDSLPVKLIQRENRIFTGLTLWSSRTVNDSQHGYCDSSDMVKVIIQTVQNQDKVLKDLYAHLR